MRVTQLSKLKQGEKPPMRLTEDEVEAREDEADAADPQRSQSRKRRSIEMISRSSRRGEAGRREADPRQR